MDILNDYINFYDSDYQDYLKTTCSDVSKVHNGYFSIDKKTGHSINGETKRGTEDSDDVSAYELILKKKERLLSFDEPTRFIFSHSALREGWDNPNVFQICTLKHADSTTAKRQEVGRGLRLCVNQDGSRMDEDACGKDVHDINLLTVVASESYKTFVESLQSDIKAALRDRPTKATMDNFTGKIIYVDGEQHKISSTEARKIYNYLIRNYYIDDITDEVSDEYRTDLANGTLATLPPDLKDMTNGIHLLIRAIFDDEVLNEMISNGNETKVRNNPLNENFYKKEFQTLWNYLNHKYTYTVKFDSEELIKKSIISLNANLNISSLMYTTSIGRQKSEMKQDEINDKESFQITKTRTQTLRNASKSSIKYDLIGKVASGTLLTRKTVAAILSGMYPEQFMKFREKPEEFINKTIRIINEQKATMIVEHISYNQTNDMYDSSIFTAEKTAQSFEKAFSAKKAVQDYIFTDGYAKDGKSVERTFLENLDVADEVCVYAKLPRGFSIPTPVGNYSPDWAIAFNENLVKHIYFVAETKGSMTSLEMREIERAKIDCAKRLFDRMSTSKVKYDVIKSYQNLMEIVK